MYTFTKDDLEQTQKKESIRKRFNGKGRPTKRTAFVLGLILVVLVGVICLHRPSTAYAVFVNGEQVAIVDDQAQGEQRIKDFLEQKSQEFGRPVTTNDNIEIKEIKINARDAVFADELEELLNKKFTLVTPAAVIAVNGEEKVAVSDKQTADKLLDRIKEEYTPKGEDIKLVKAAFKEKVEVKEKNVPVQDICDVEKAFQFLTVGTEKIVIHVVESGESLWSIARKNNLTVKDLQMANPQIKSDRIDIGDEIKLTKAEPMLHVAATFELSETKPIPYEVQTIDDKNLVRGQQKVKQAGKSGSKEFRYLIVQENGVEVDRQFIEGKVLSQPVTKIVRRGTKLVLASRSGGGRGSLGWPLRGPITSPFGYRHGEYHTGLDIDGVTGDYVRAAEGGTVTSVGWGGNYGRLIKVSHGSGVETWYAHLSKYSVSAGDKVERGEVIGLVGNTGRSTGSHLHFEVRINGSPVNPLKYLD